MWIATAGCEASGARRHPPADAGYAMMNNREQVEAHWLTNHGVGWLAGYENSVTQPWRQPVAAALRTLAPFQRVLDLGCNVGVMVPFVEAASPGAQVLGVDINKESVLRAKQLHPRHLFVHDSVLAWVPFMRAHGQKVDVATSCSTLEHCHPDDLPALIVALVAVVTRGIVLQEVTPMPRLPVGPTPGMEIFEWRHDYEALFAPHGWRLVDRVRQNVDTYRPSAVMVFRPEKVDDL